MRSKFRFKSLILALLMAVTPVLGVASQNPFVADVSAIVVTDKERSKVAESETAKSAQSPQTQVISADSKNSKFGIIFKKSLSCVGLFALGFVAAFPISAIVSITGGILAVNIGLSVKIGCIVGDYLGFAFGSMPFVLRICDNIDDIVTAVKQK